MFQTYIINVRASIMYVRSYILLLSFAIKRIILIAEGR